MNRQWIGSEYAANSEGIRSVLSVNQLTRSSNQLLTSGVLPRSVLLDTYSLLLHLLITSSSLSGCWLTAYSLPIHCLFTACSLPIHCLFTAYSLPIHCLFTAYLLAYSLSFHWPFYSSLSLSIFEQSSAYSLPIHLPIDFYIFFIYTVIFIPNHSLLYFLFILNPTFYLSSFTLVI